MNELKNQKIALRIKHQGKSWTLSRKIVEGEIKTPDDFTNELLSADLNRGFSDENAFYKAVIDEIIKLTENGNEIVKLSKI